MLIPERFYALAPEKLPNLRRERFDGAGFGLDLAAFGPGDRLRLARVYAAVNAVGHSSKGANPAALAARLLALDSATLLRDAASLGSDTPEAVTTEPRVRQLLHDIRGGGLQVLVATAELLRFSPAAAEFVGNAVSAARDHAKIMRAGFPALDPARYADDESARVHAIDGFITTWDGLTLRQHGRPVAVAVACEYRGAITGRCLETASIDRILYNYVNNAVRFAADGKVAIWIFRAGPDLVRWVVHNALSAEDRAWADRTTGGNPRKLFHGGTTRGGNGVGLSGCAEIVAACFGLDAEQVLRAGHIGARIDATGYSAWFHWPTYEVVGEPEHAAACVCHV